MEMKWTRSRKKVVTLLSCYLSFRFYSYQFKKELGTLTQSYSEAIQAKEGVCKIEDLRQGLYLNKMSSQIISHHRLYRKSLASRVCNCSNVCLNGTMDFKACEKADFA